MIARNPAYDHSPQVLFYEVTRACDLACRHCRAAAQPIRHPAELTTELSCQLIDQVAAFPCPPILVLTGGDPVKRPDLVELIAHGRQRGLCVALAPSATPLLDREMLSTLASAGLHRIALSIDGSGPEIHDGLRGVPGSLQWTLRVVRDAQEAGLAVQINTTVSRRNVHELAGMALLAARLGAVLWSVFFLVPVGRGRAEKRITPQEYERAFDQLSTLARTHGLAIKTTEAPHYRRFVLQQGADAGRLSGGTNDGRGVAFVSHTGRIFPSGFLPITCGRFPHQSPVTVYQDAPLFRKLRDADQLHGKCGRCPFRWICGGSRARAYAVTADPMAEEPDCAYVPEGCRNEVPAC